MIDFLKTFSRDQITLNFFKGYFSRTNLCGCFIFFNILSMEFPICPVNNSATNNQFLISCLPSCLPVWQTSFFLHTKTCQHDYVLFVLKHFCSKLLCFRTRRRTPIYDIPNNVAKPQFCDCYPLSGA